MNWLAGVGLVDNCSLGCGGLWWGLPNPPFPAQPWTPPPMSLQRDARRAGSACLAAGGALRGWRTSVDELDPQESARLGPTLADTVSRLQQQIDWATHCHQLVSSCQNSSQTVCHLPVAAVVVVVVLEIPLRTPEIDQHGQMKNSSAGGGIRRPPPPKMVWPCPRAFFKVTGGFLSSGGWLRHETQPPFFLTS